MKKLIKINYTLIDGRGKKTKLVEHVDQIPDKVVGSQVHVDRHYCKAKRIVYKLDGVQVDLVKFVQSWLDYRRFGEDRKVAFTIDYTLTSSQYAYA